MSALPPKADIRVGPRLRLAQLRAQRGTRMKEVPGPLVATGQHPTALRKAFAVDLYQRAAVQCMLSVFHDFVHIPLPSNGAICSPRQRPNRQRDI
jgi:hypothetical protein